MEGDTGHPVFQTQFGEVHFFQISLKMIYVYGWYWISQKCFLLILIKLEGPFRVFLFFFFTSLQVELQ